MILKESFRHQNFLDNILGQALNYLYDDGNIMKVKEIHHKNKANPKDEDEEIEIKKEQKDYTVNDIIDFVMDIIDEKEKLTKAIDKTKLMAEMNIDSSISMNKHRQRVAGVFKILSDTKSSETKTTGKGYLINGEGNQTPYTYEIERITTIDFDRNKTKALVKKLNKTSDEVSTQKDRYDIILEVEYEPKYDIDNSLDDCVEIFLGQKSAISN